MSDQRSRNHGVNRQPLKELANSAKPSPGFSTALKPIVPSAVHSANTTPIQQDPRSRRVNLSTDPSGAQQVASERQRVAQLAAEDERDTKRDSGVSTTSTTASSRRRKTYIGHWQLGKTIGKGGCSRVRVVRHRFREQYGAVKIITRSTAESTRAQSLANLTESTKFMPVTTNGHKPIPFGLEREIAIMKLLEHENIVRLYDVWENRNELYLIMEYVDGGELFHYVEERKGLGEYEAVYIFRQLVSALLYCHRLRICHRDLKPENILLNRRNLTVKVIDFGMAALQPEGRLLSTPCGSPHYAAPEVISGRPYDGTMADVWSCGVILYVMLTGTAPYNYGPENDIRDLFLDIAQARYYMPPELSPEAQNLIRGIFIPSPSHRANMDQVWDHALLHKYDKELGYIDHAGTKEAAIGSIPTIEQWKVQRVQDVDREILRNMRTLWHNESEQVLIQRLLDNEYNQEKLFYAALLKHREEHLENFVGDVDNMEHSTSDYHHSRAMQATRAARSQSQYTILNDEHLRSSRSFVEAPPSNSSYDPYRASRKSMTTAKGNYVNVTVHRAGTMSRRHDAKAKHSSRNSNNLRIEVLKHGSRRASSHSVSSLAGSTRSRISLQRSLASRSSMTSIAWASSPPVLTKVRPSEQHKRGVSFNHLRRASTVSCLTGRDSRISLATTSKSAQRGTPTEDSAIARERRKSAMQKSTTPSIASPAIRSRKERNPKQDGPQVQAHGPGGSMPNIKNEIRKHSVELEKACEEAFFRSSVASTTTVQTPTTARVSSYDTPPSSISDCPTEHAINKNHTQSPKETPKTYLTRTLEETREKLAAYKASGKDNTLEFDEIMQVLESFVLATPIPRPQDNLRNFSSPESRTLDNRDALPVISEESNDPDDHNAANWQRSVTAPVPSRPLAGARTVRMVAPSSVPSLPPSSARKPFASPKHSVKVATEESRERNVKTGRSHGDVEGERANNLSTIREEPLADAQDTSYRKSTGWFGFGKKSSTQKIGLNPPAKAGAEDISPLSTKQSPVLPLLDEQGEPRRKQQTGTKTGLSKWFGSKSADAPVNADTEQGKSTTADHSLDTLFSAESPTLGTDEKGNGQGQSWFARFFRIRPVIRVLCFTIPRNRARQELVILLREWQRHGVRDLQFCRQTNTISARVDRDNALSIKPVSFRIELFVVLEHGRKTGLSIGRLVQVKGAASGFKKVVEVIDGVMRGRGWLVEDEERWKALSEIVGGSL